LHILLQCKRYLPGSWHRLEMGLQQRLFCQDICAQSSLWKHGVCTSLRPDCQDSPIQRLSGPIVTCQLGPIHLNWAAQFHSQQFKRLSCPIQPTGQPNSMLSVTILLKTLASRDWTRLQASRHVPPDQHSDTGLQLQHEHYTTGRIHLVWL
jgi:hypothetical protein